MPLSLWELKKVFVNQKSAVILAVILYIAVSSAFQYRYVLPSYTRSEEKYYQRYTGEMTVELQTEMNADLDDLQAQFDALRDEYLTKLDANGGLHDDELMKMYNRLMDMAEDLEFLRFVPFETSILGYLVLMFIVRMLGAFAVGALVMLISRYSGSTITAVCISAAIIIVPAVLSGTGVLPVPSAADIVGYCVMI